MRDIMRKIKLLYLQSLCCSKYSSSRAYQLMDIRVCTGGVCVLQIISQIYGVHGIMSVPNIISEKDIPDRVNTCWFAIALWEESDPQKQIYFKKESNASSGGGDNKLATYRQYHAHSIVFFTAYESRLKTFIFNSFCIKML